MKEETEKIFNVPWRVVEYKKCEGHYTWAVVETYNGRPHFVARKCEQENAHRLSRLPELFDALKEAVREACQDCVDETEQRTGMLFDPVEDGCIYPERDCCTKCRKWIDLLKKVKEGK